MIVLNAFLSIAPVIVFLLGLIYLDSFKLVRLSSVIRSILAGVGVALICLLVNSQLLKLLALDQTDFSRYVAPAVEESFKALFIIFLITRKRIGFSVDAAIHGFAVGAGFALVENLYYLVALQETNPVLFAIRGFGTAVMHGGATAIFAIAAKTLADRLGSSHVAAYLPGILLTYLLHSAYNHFPFTPLVTTILILILAPLGVIIVFQRSEATTRNWLGVGLDADAEMLESILSGEISDSKVGKYLESLKSRFAGEAIADMLCLLRIQLELSLQAKGILLMREAGIKVGVDPQVKERFEELQYLEESIGTTGKLALSPVLSRSARDLWQLYFLKE